LIDARIIVLGVLDRPRTSLTVNPNAQVFLRPPGARPARSGDTTNGADVVSNRSNLPASRVAGKPLRCRQPYDELIGSYTTYRSYFFQSGLSPLIPSNAFTVVLQSSDVYSWWG
jgi:hypothetical protein